MNKELQAKADGWKYDYDFLKSLTQKVNESAETLSMEDVQSVLEAINYSPSLREQPLREALETIANPIPFLQKEAERNGAKLDGRYAIELSNNVNWLQEIARTALEGIPKPLQNSSI